MNELLFQNTQELKKSFIFDTDDKFLNRVNEITIDDCVALSHNSERYFEDHHVHRCLFEDNNNLYFELIDERSPIEMLTQLRKKFRQSIETQNTPAWITTTPQKRIPTARLTKSVPSLASRFAAIKVMSENSFTPPTATISKRQLEEPQKDNFHRNHNLNSGLLLGDRIPTEPEHNESYANSTDTIINRIRCRKLF